MNETQEASRASALVYRVWQLRRSTLARLSTPITKSERKRETSSQSGTTQERVKIPDRLRKLKAAAWRDVLSLLR